MMFCRWLALWAMLAPFAVQADSPPADVDARLTAMQAQLDALDKRLEQLQQMLQACLPPADTAADTRPSAEAPRAQPRLAAYQELEELRANWKQLQRGLSPAELRQLLGKPRSELAFDRQTLWYYLYPGIGAGSVMLDSRGKVTGWQEPPFRGW